VALRMVSVIGWVATLWDDIVLVSIIGGIKVKLWLAGR